MTLTELETQFPGLFEPAACQSLSEAERHADKVASKAGLTVRISAETNIDGIRRIEYRDPASRLGLHVEISLESARGSKPFYLFHCWGERLDARLTMKSPHNVRAKPLSFQREAQFMLARLRSLQVQDDGRVTGRLKQWDPRRGVGLIECLPGALVILFSNELPAGLEVAHSDRLSFTINKSSDRQKATNVRRCSAQ